MVKTTEASIGEINLTKTQGFSREEKGIKTYWISMSCQMMEALIGMTIRKTLLQTML
jgi:hypothetical protein